MKTKMPPQSARYLPALAGADGGFELRDDEGRDVFEDDLQLARIVDAQLRADDQADGEDDQDDERAEDQVVRDVEAERGEQRVDGFDEWGGMFEGFHEPEIVPDFTSWAEGLGPRSQAVGGFAALRIPSDLRTPSRPS